MRRLDWEAAELERILKDVVSEMNREKSKLIFGDGEYEIRYKKHYCSPVLSFYIVFHIRPLFVLGSFLL